jgi:hypothetical protein
MWYLFTVQLVLSACMTTVCVVGSVTMLHVQEETNRSAARLLPDIRQHLQTEQDADKLRLEANGLLDETVSDAESREAGLRFMVKMSAMFGAALFVISSGSGICAYKLQRQLKSQQSLL